MCGSDVVGSKFVGLMGLKVQDGIMLPFYIFLVLNASLLLSRSLSDCPSLALSGWLSTPKASPLMPE